MAASGSARLLSGVQSLQQPLAARHMTNARASGPGSGLSRLTVLAGARVDQGWLVLRQAETLAKAPCGPALLWSSCPGWRQRERRGSVVVQAGDFDGGDDDIIEFDAEDAELDEDVEVEELVSEEEKLMEASSLLQGTIGVVETTLVGDDVAPAPAEEGFWLQVQGSMRDSVIKAKEGMIPGAPCPLGFALDEDQFHRVQLYSCNFFVRKAPDAEDDVFDFSEVYVASPGSMEFATPTIHGVLPEQPRRCTLNEWTYVTGKMMPYSTDPYHASAKEIQEVAKVFLIRHFNDERAGSPEFVLDLEEIYVLDGQERSLRRASVEVSLPEDARDRKQETLIIRDDGNTFKIVRRGEQKHMDQVIAEHHWQQTRDSVETYLRGFRDFEQSNWF